MSTLKRIILIATHLPGEVELKLDGHTNICGTNASGKTTLQRLVPVFYGEYPSRVVPATRDSFERWYLPTDASYIIYEYERPNGELAQAVLSSAGDGKGVQYRFVDKGFDMEDYIKSRQDDQVICFTSGEMKKVFRAQGVVISNQITSVKDYRAIIQNDRGLMNAASNSRELRDCAARFALCEANATLRHMEKLVRAVHSKEGKMETIRQMVAAILEEDGVETPQTRLNANRVDEWIRESQLVQHFEQTRPQFAKLEQRYDAFQLVEQELAGLKAGFSNDKILLEEAIEQHQRERRECLAQLEEAVREYEAQSGELIGKRSYARSDAENYEKRLERIEDEHQAWLEMEIETAARDLERLGQWRADLQDLRERHTLLTEKHSDIEATYTQHRGQIEVRNNAAIESLRERQDQVRGQQSDLQRQQQNEIRTLEDGFRHQSQAAEQRHHSEQKTLELEQQRLQMACDSAGFNSDERRQLDLLEARIDEAYQQQQSAEQVFEQHREEEQRQRQARQALQDQLSQLRQQMTQCQSDYDAIDALRFPKDHSLLKFLRQERPEWIHSIGKVIRPELLKRGDLKPALGDGEHTLFGVALDLGNLDTPEYAQNEQQLEQRAEQARKVLEQCRAEQSQMESRIEAQQAEMQSASEAVIRAQTQYQSAKSQHARLLDEKKQLSQTLRAAVAERKLAAEKQLKAVQAELKKLVSEYDSFVEELKAQQLEARMDKEAFWQERLGNVEEQLTQLSGELSNRRAQKNEELAECERWYQAELKERGVDDSQILALKEQIHALDQKIGRTESMRDKVADYQIWFKGPFTLEQPQLQDKLAIAQRELLELDQMLAKLQREHKALGDELKAGQKTAEQALTRANEQLEQLKQLLTALTKLALPAQAKAEDYATAPLDERLREAQEKLQQRDQHLSVIKQQVEHFDSLIGQKAGPELAANWEQWRSDCVSNPDNELGVAKLDHMKLVPHLQYMMNHLLPQRMEVLRTTGQTFGKELETYYHVLADIDKRIGTQSARITREVGEELFLDGVSGSEVKIRSRISELEFWDELTLFIQSHQKWQAQGFVGLPGDEYAQRLRRALEVIGRAALSGSIAKLLEIELRLREGNSDLVIRTDRQLNESSSHGMAYLILCKFLLAFTRLLRGNAGTVIHWPIDELGTLHHGNVKKIFDACENNRIAVLGAFPNPESEVLALFQNRYIINKNTRQLQVVQPKVSPIAERLKARAMQEELTA
ncbi:ATP-binding protein [Marinobacter hydrocarbonoclasticus]|nr:ATP-binding protein [Marinobacter nauticus]